MNTKTIKALTRGITLVEMLVTLLILSIGLLGVAALQSRGQQFNYASYVRTQSTMVGNEIMEQIKANRVFAKTDVITYGTISTIVGRGYVVYSISNLTSTDKYLCDNNPCTPAQLRTYDLARWYDRLAATLPGGTGAISVERFPEPPPNPLTGQEQVRYTISITWELRESEQDDDSVQSKTKTITWVIQI